MSLNYDLGGNDIICNSLSVGATAPGQAGTVLAGTELAVLDGVTPGTAAAGKALVLGASGEISTITTATVTTLTSTTITPTTIAGNVSFSGNPTFAAGKTLDLDSATATLSSNAATVTKYACVVTSESLTTAAGASQAFVITLTGVAAGDLAFVTKCGGTNTRHNYQLEAVTTTDTVTVTLYNTEPTNAINGTVKFNVWVLKA